MVGVISTSEDDGRDERVFMHRVSWEGYESLLAARGENARPLIAYLDGELELMSPGPNHERIKEGLSMLLALYCSERGIAAQAYGNWTVRTRRGRAGAEPDSCFVFGRDQVEPQRPDVAIEVVWSHGGIEKLEIYRRLGVPEVWFWEQGGIAIHQLVGDRYEPVATSRFVPDFPFARACELAEHEILTDAILKWRDELAK